MEKLIKDVRWSGWVWVGEFLLVPAYPGSPGPTAVKRLCVCVCTIHQLQSSSSSQQSVPLLLCRVQSHASGWVRWPRRGGRRDGRRCGEGRRESTTPASPSSGTASPALSVHTSHRQVTTDQQTHTESNPLKWIALKPDYDYPLIYVLYFTLCLNGTRQVISV